MAPVKGRSVSVCTCCTSKCLYVRMRSLQAYGEDLRASLCAGRRMEQSSASQGCSLLINESLQLLQCLQPMLRLFICFVNCSLWLACGLREASLLDGTYCRMNHHSFTLRAHSAQHIPTLMSLKHGNNRPSSRICPVCMQ